MTTSIAMIDSNAVLKEAVKNYIEEYKQNRYSHEEKVRLEVKVSKNIKNILSEQNSISLDDIAAQVSIDPFSGQKVNMKEVVPLEGPRYAVADEEGVEKKTPAEKGAPKIVPTNKKELMRIQGGTSHPVFIRGVTYPPGEYSRVRTRLFSREG